MFLASAVGFSTDERGSQKLVSMYSCGLVLFADGYLVLSKERLSAKTKHR
jgi:hypothetical protein